MKDAPLSGSVAAARTGRGQRPPVPRAARFVLALYIAVAAVLVLGHPGISFARDMRFLEEMAGYLRELNALSYDMLSVEERIGVAEKAIRRLKAQPVRDVAEKYDWSACYIMILNNIGPSYVAKGEHAKGRDFLSQAVAIGEEALADAPGDQNLLALYFVSQRALAISYRMELDHRSCASHNEDALSAVRELLRQDPGNQARRADMREALLELGQSSLILKEWKSARERCLEAVDLARQALAQDPNDADARWDLAEGLARLEELEKVAPGASAAEKRP